MKVLLLNFILCYFLKYSILFHFFFLKRKIVSLKNKNLNIHKLSQQTKKILCSFVFRQQTYVLLMCVWKPLEIHDMFP